MDKKIVSINESRLYLSAWGNENIIRNHVAYFEKKLVEEIAAYKSEKTGVSLAHYPNFAAWIRLYTELICNSLYWKLFRSEGDWEKTDKMKYGEARDYLIKEIAQQTVILQKDKDKNKVKNMKEAINLIVNLRHSFQHWGLPNRVINLKYSSDPAKFDRMLNPNNYKETKEIFLKAEKLIKLLPQPPVILST